MSRVFGMHMIALRPGVKAEDFEKFVIEEAYPFPWPSEVYLLKGDRGDREGKYLVMYEFESVEARDRSFPPLQASRQESINNSWNPTQQSCRNCLRSGRLSPLLQILSAPTTLWWANRCSRVMGLRRRRTAGALATIVVVIGKDSH